MLNKLVFFLILMGSTNTLAHTIKFTIQDGKRLVILFDKSEKKLKEQLWKLYEKSPYFSLSDINCFCGLEKHIELMSSDQELSDEVREEINKMFASEWKVTQAIFDNNPDNKKMLSKWESHDGIKIDLDLSE